MARKKKTAPARRKKKSTRRGALTRSGSERGSLSEELTPYVGRTVSVGGGAFVGTLQCVATDGVTIVLDGGAVMAVGMASIDLVVHPAQGASPGMFGAPPTRGIPPDEDV